MRGALIYTLLLGIAVLFSSCQKVSREEIEVKEERKGKTVVSDPAEILHQQGKEYCAKKEYEKSVQVFEKVLKKYPRSETAPKSLFNLGIIYSTFLKDERKGIAYLKKFLKKYPQHELVQDVQASILQLKDKTAQAYHNEGKKYFQEKEFDQAIESFNWVVQNYPGTPTAAKSLFNLGIVYVAGLEDKAKASEAFNQFIRKHPDDELLPKAISALIQLKEEKERVTYCQELIAHYLDSPAISGVAFDGIIALYSEQNEPSQIILECRKIISKYPDKPVASSLLVKVAEYLEKEVKYDQLRALYGQILAEYPKYEIALLAFDKLTSLYLDYLRDDLAVETSNYILKVYPATELAKQAQRVLGDIYYKKGNYVKALSAFSEAPEEETSVVQEPASFFRYQAEDVTAESFQQMLARFKAVSKEKEFKVAEVLEAVADSFYRSGAYLSALRFYQRTAFQMKKLPPPLIDDKSIELVFRKDKYKEEELAAKARFWKAFLNYAREWYDQAFPEYEQTVREIPTTPEAAQAHYYLAKRLLLENDISGAFSHIQAAKKLFPQSKDILTLAEKITPVYENILKADKKVKKWQGILQANPTPEKASEAYLELARAYYEKREFSKSAKEFEKLIQRYPSSEYVSRALYNLGTIYSTFLDDRVKARKHLGALISRYPDSELIPKAMELLNKMGQKKK